MKKNISINISGIIFHIEEDGYEKFKTYLDSINQYFSSYEDSEEIIADIESRIAEIFLEKLDEGKQVISNDDVNVLMNTMGQVSDFEAMEDETDFVQSEPKAKTQSTKSEEGSKTKEEKKASSRESYGSRKLVRDGKNHILGGVASGLAYYGNFDPIWTRILFILLLPTGISVLGYIILWIALPEDDNLPEDDSVKKFYRDPDDRVLGGVAAGLAKYFKTDTIVIRILFIVLFFGAGTGLLAYIVLWIIAPQANSITDKMQMKGEKVTLSNIESNIKKNKEEELNPKGENAFTTVLLFPFRLIGKLFSALGRAFAPILLFLAAAIRIFTGGILSIIGLSVMFSMVVTAAVFFGLYNGDWFFYGDEFSYFPVEVFSRTFPELGVLLLCATIFIPFLYLFIAGITIIAKRRVMSSSVGWSILGIWLIAIFGTFATIPNVVRDFRDEGYYEETEILNVEADTLVLDINMIRYTRYDDRRYRGDWEYSYESEFTDLDIRASRDNTYRLEKRFRARGRDPRDAENNAQEVVYEYKVSGNKITFDSEISFGRDTEFRFQELDAKLFIPKNVPFQLKDDMRTLVHYFTNRYSWRQVYRNTWMFDDAGRLVCLTCNDQERWNNRSRGSLNEHERSINVDRFDEVEIWEDFETEITYGRDYQVKLVGPRAKVEDVFVNVSNGELNVDQDGSDRDWSNVKLYIQAPSLSAVKGRNGAQITFDIEQASFTTFSAYHTSKIFIESDLDDIKIYVTDRAEVEFTGKTDKADLYLDNRSRFYGYEGSMNEAVIETSAEARARLNVNDYLEVDAGGFSSVRYKGNPDLEITGESNSASITKY